MNNPKFKHFIGLVLLLSLAACGGQVRLTPPPVTATRPNPAVSPTSSPTPAVTATLPSASTVPPSGGLLEPGSAPIPPQPTPADIVGGGIIQNGPFIFYLWLFRDPMFNPQPDITSLYSDLDGFGIYMSWVYQGVDLEGPVHVSWGTLPQLREFDVYPTLTHGQGGGGEGGIGLPGGRFSFIPGESKAGDRVQVGMKVDTPQGEYGAVLTFTLQQGARGFEPTDIMLELLPPGTAPTP